MSNYAAAALKFSQKHVLRTGTHNNNNNDSQMVVQTSSIGTYAL